MRILLVEDGPLDARLVEEMLVRSRSLQPQLTHVMYLADVLAHLESDTFDVILLDLSLPDSRGLGLSIAREIVQRHHGRIAVASEGQPGKGANFTIWLPAADNSV